MWSPPDTVAEFTIVKPIGAGAMGRVFLARDTLLGRTVAIKFVGAAEVSENARERFYREARAIARLAHPNVVGIHRVGEFRQRPYLVSEYVDGESLDRLPKPMGWSRVVSIGIGIARGLAAAHHRDVLHRDIKPANIILCPDGSAKLLDFGLASIAGEDPRPRADKRSDDPLATAPAAGRVEAVAETARADQPEPLVGTPLYLAPELWRGTAASIASDIYAFGLVLYELLAGRAPRAGKSLEELRAAADEPIDDLEVHAPATPMLLLRLVMACVDRDSTKRPASVDAILEQLERLRAPVTTDSPYRGLLAFQSEQRELFFGRNQDIALLAERLRRDEFVVVAGDSGVGKSSLCRAGVLPTFIEQEGSRWRVRIVTPGAKPLQTFGEISTEEPTILFVDQLEELVTLSPVDQRDAAARRLVELTCDPNRCRVLATARNDFLGRLAELDKLGEMLSRSLVLVGPLSERGLREAITAPARVAGFQFEPALVTELVASGRRSLPLLQFALHELWDARDEQTKQIPLTALTAIGGVGGALAKHADRVMAGFDERDRDQTWQMLLRLVTADGTRASIPLAKLIDLAPTREDGERVIERLVQARLVVVQPDDERRVEVAHEALFSKWPRLVEWRRAHDQDARFRDRVVEAAAHWRERNRPRGLLWRGNALGEYRAWRARWQEPLAPFEREFGDASEAESRRARRILAGVVGTIVLGLAIGMLLLYRADQRTRAQQRILFAEQAGTEHTAGYDARALPYLLQLRREGEDSAAIHLAIADASRDLLRATGDVVTAPRGTVDARWTSDGKTMVVAERGGRLHLASAVGAIEETWDVGTELSPPALRADGSLAAVDSDGALWQFSRGARPTRRVPRLRTRDPRTVVELPTSAVAFEPNGNRVASLGPDGVTRIWEPSGEIRELDESGAYGSLAATEDVFVACHVDGRVDGWRWNGTRAFAIASDRRDGGCSVAFSGKGDVVISTAHRLLVVSVDRSAPPRERRYGVGIHLAGVSTDRIALYDDNGRVEVVALDSLETISTFLQPHGALLSHATLSRDGKWLASSTTDGFFRVWNVERRVAPIAIAATPYAGTAKNAPQGALSARFSSDGALLMMRSGVDVRLIRLDNWPILASLCSSCRGVLAARWSGDETAIAASGEALAAIIDARGSTPLVPPPSRGWDAAWTKDGRQVLVVGDDGYAKVFAREGTLIRDLSGHRGHVNHASTSPDGRYFATASDDHYIRIFDVASGQRYRQFDVGTRAVSVAWSPDGRHVAAAGYDGSIPIWNVESGELKQRPFDPSTQFLDITYDPTGNRLATAGHDSVVRIWDLEDESYRELLGHQGPVTGVTWSRDGHLIASSAETGGIRIWDPATGREVARRDLGMMFMSVEWSRDGNRLLVPGLGSSLFVMEVRHDPMPLAALERLVDEGAWDLVDGRLVRKQESFRPH